MAEFDGEYLLSLARDKSGKRRKLLAETISDLFSGKGHVLTERERTLMFDILHKMVRNAEMAVRRIIAEQLSKISEAPKDLILLLANDEVEVAYSILHDSAVLQDEDLIEVIRHRTQEHHLAISVRRTVSEEVADALVETGDESVITTLLKNSGASLSLATMEFLVEESKRVDSFQEPILSRDDLEPALANACICGFRRRSGNSFWTISNLIRRFSTIFWKRRPRKRSRRPPAGPTNWPRKSKARAWDWRV